MTKQPTEPIRSRVQARITLPDPLLEVIDPMRMRWGPERAAGNPAHVTIVYHDEVASQEELVQRVRAAAGACKPFTLVLGRAERFATPDRGALLSVMDPGDGVGAIRQRVLVPPCTPRQRFGLHVTVLHPASGDRLEEAWPEITSMPALGAFEVREVQMVGQGNVVIERMRLGVGEHHSNAEGRISTRLDREEPRAIAAWAVPPRMLHRESGCLKSKTPESYDLGG